MAEEETWEDEEVVEEVEEEAEEEQDEEMVAEEEDWVEEETGGVVAAGGFGGGDFGGEDSYTEVTSESWASRLGRAIVGVLVGIVMFLLAFPVLWWNEGDAVRTYKSLLEGAGAVISVSADRVDSSNEGKLVHVTGMATTKETLTDPEFGISVNAIRLSRQVEMYQWVENKETREEKQLGGSKKKVTTYTYGKEWSSSVNNSGTFKKPKGHQNPNRMPYEQETWAAKNVTVGGFGLPSSLASQIGNAQDISVSEKDIPKRLSNKAKIHNSGFYVGRDPFTSSVGDVQVTFKKTEPAQVSVVAVQRGNSFEPYRADAGETVYMLSMGTRASNEMFASAQAGNTFMTWVFRVGGFLIMAIGIALVFKPLSVVADIIPFIGNIVGIGTSILSFCIALAFSFVTIAIAWIFYRPVVAVILLAIAGGSIFLVMKMKKPQAQPVAA